MAYAAAPETPAKIAPPRVQADAGKSAAGSADGAKKDLKTSIMGILKADAKPIDAGKTKIDEIADKRKSLQVQGKKLMSELRNETRKRQRIRKRSQYLTDEDLVEVLAMRKTKQQKTDAKGSSSGKKDLAA